MPTTTRKQPTDRKPPAAKMQRADTYSFTHDGVTYTSLELSSVITPGWVRRNRRRDELDIYMTLFEDVFAGVDGALEAYDAMSWEESQDVVGGLSQMLESTVGESLRSSS